MKKRDVEGERDERVTMIVGIAREGLMFCILANLKYFIIIFSFSFYLILLQIKYIKRVY
jgi:hypothetical protein